MLRYDLVGRGYSSCGGFPHTWRLFVSQLAELLLCERIPLPVDLIGYSIGAQVVAAFAATHAHAVRSAVPLCPAIVTSSWLPTLMQLEPLRWLVGHAATLMLRDRSAYASDWLHLGDSEPQEVREASRRRLAALHEVELGRDGLTVARVLERSRPKARVAVGLGGGGSERLVF